MVSRQIRVRSTGAWRREMEEASRELNLLELHCILEVVELLDEINWWLRTVSRQKNSIMYNPTKAQAAAAT